MLATIYRPPDGNVNNFCEEMTQMANSILERDKHELFIMGDFNINMNNKQSNETKHLSQTWGLYQRIGLDEICPPVAFVFTDSARQKTYQVLIM